MLLELRFPHRLWEIRSGYINGRCLAWQPQQLHATHCDPFPVVAVKPTRKRHTAIIEEAPCPPVSFHLCRDDNLDTDIWYPSGNWPDEYRYGDNFLSVGDTRIRSESRRVRDGYFFSPAINPMGTWYFTIAIIVRCEQVKMCSFCYINYDLFWLLNFTTRLSQIFVEY
jgi:hypothetical protein